MLLGAFGAASAGSGLAVWGGPAPREALPKASAAGLQLPASRAVPGWPFPHTRPLVRADRPLPVRTGQ